MPLNNKNASILQIFLLLTVCAAVCLVVLLLARIVGFFLVNVSLGDVTFYELFMVLWAGMYFDVVTIVRLCILPILFSPLMALFPNIIRSIYITFLKYWIVAVMLIFLFTSFGNFAYLAFFGNPFDTFVFESLNFGWRIIFYNVFGTDVGFSIFILGGVLLCCIAVYAAFKLNYALYGYLPLNLSKWKTTLATVFLTLVLVVTGRGKLGTFPLSVMHASVTSNYELNHLVLNGPFQLYESAKDFNSSEVLAPATASEGREVFKNYFGREADDGLLFPQFFTTTEKNQVLEDSPPHVVLVIAESLSSSLLDSKYTGSNELGRNLRQHFDEDGWFSRFTPAHNYTHGSVSNLLTNLNCPAISKSRYNLVQLETSAAKVYQQQGYRTIYLYSGYESEWGAASYYLRQGFDEFIGTGHLLKRYPHMPINAWGGEDFYASNYAKSLLTKSDKPLFIVFQTLTNHPPYFSPMLPWLKQPLPINTKMRHVNGSLPDEALRTYHYTTEVLGEFLDYVKQTNLADRTIVAITGDHGQRGALKTPTTDVFTKAVPFYVYTPPSLQPKKPKDYNVLGSHRDIMPTLYNLSLSGASYLNIGNNLFNSVASDEQFAILHGSTVTNEGLITADSTGLAKNFVANSLLQEMQLSKINHTKAIIKAEAYQQVIDWLKRYQLQVTYQ